MICSSLSISSHIETLKEISFNALYTDPGKEEIECLEDDLQSFLNNCPFCLIITVAPLLESYIETCHSLEIGWSSLEQKYSHVHTIELDI